MSVASFELLFDWMMSVFGGWYSLLDGIIIGPLSLWKWFLGLFVFGLIYSVLIMYSGLSGPVFSIVSGKMLEASRNTKSVEKSQRNKTSKTDK